MAPALDRQDGLVAQLGRDRVGTLRKLGLRRQEIDRREHLDVGLDRVRVAPDLRGERFEDASHLALFLYLQRTYAVVRLERGERLDEQRLPARARVVDDARQSAGELGFDRNHESPVTNRHDAILDRLGVFGGVEDRADAIARVGLRLCQAATDAPQGVRRPVEHRAALVERVYN